MFLGSRQRDHQLCGDLLIGETIGHELQDAPFLRGERLRKRRRRGWLNARRARSLALKRVEQMTCVDGHLMLRDRVERAFQEERHRLPFIQKQALIPLWTRQPQRLQQGGLGLGYRLIRPVGQGLQDLHLQHGMSASLGFCLRFPGGKLLQRCLCLPPREGQTNNQERLFLLLHIWQHPLSLRSICHGLEAICPRARPVFDSGEIAHVELEPGSAVA